MVVQAETSAKFANMEWDLKPAGCNEVRGTLPPGMPRARSWDIRPLYADQDLAFDPLRRTRCAAVGAVDRLQFQLSKNAAELMPGPVRFVWRPIRTVVFLDRKSKRRQKKLRLACSVATG